MSPVDVTAIDAPLRALAGVGLAGAPALTRKGWAARIDAVREHGLAGLLDAADRLGLVDLDDGTRGRVVARIESEAVRAVQLEGELLRLEPTITALHGVVLKGAVLAHAAYPDPALRPFTDIDLLVTGERHAAAVRALEDLGYERARPEPVRGYDASIGKALTMVHPGGVVVDLHRTLVTGLAGASIDVDEILATAVEVPVNGRPVRAPGWDAHLVEVCLHAVVGDGLARAISVRDVAQVATHPAVDPGHVVELARRWKVTAIVATALRAAVESFGTELPHSLAVLAAGTAGTDVPMSATARSSRARLEELRGGGLRRRLRVARSLVAPSREFLHFTYGDGSAPRLYARRWKALYRRTRTASTPEPPMTARSDRLPQVHARHEPDADTRPVERAAAGIGRDGPRATIARARPPVGVASLTAAAGPPLQSLSAAALPPIPSRQERWTRSRPSRVGAGPRPAIRVGEGAPPPLPPEVLDGEEPTEDPEPTRTASATATAAGSQTSSGTSFCVVAVVILLLTMGGARVGLDWIGIVTIPIAGILFAFALWRRLERVRPDEAWLGRWLVLGVMAKLVASYARYFTLVSSYSGVGDASDYDTVGKQFVAFWMGNGPNPLLPDLRKTNFVRWFTGVVYYVFGSNIVAGYFVFGLLALIGTYLWYRATADSVPFLNKRLYLGLLLFAPSLAFWPSSIGKESLMQLGLGVMAMAVAMFLKQRLLLGLLIGLPGGWLLWVVRPHLLAMAMIGATFAYVVGRVGTGKKGNKGVGTRTIGLIVIAFIMAFSVGQMMKFLGMKDLSLNSVDQTLNQQQERTAQGGSSFDNGGDYLSPVNLPRGIMTVLLRPFPWEVDTPYQLLASAESAVVAGLLIMRFSSVRASLTRARGTPFLLYCWVFTLLYAASFASFANFGLLVRERSLALPAFFVLLCLEIARDTEKRQAITRAAARPLPQGAGT